ncbi:hypothetical protein NPIL_564161 [Nephila pilipes]|uniref:Uncharacterized protein n=1 Tax=Nephila pilipes TaxID=299642 RepID=A0A8X6U112_NEPPI|nr:hypothetical protein NPIL_564161 [Nephila pilipes]
MPFQRILSDVKRMELELSNNRQLVESKLQIVFLPWGGDDVFNPYTNPMGTSYLTTYTRQQFSIYTHPTQKSEASAKAFTILRVAVKEVTPKKRIYGAKWGFLRSFWKLKKKLKCFSHSSKKENKFM